MGFSADQIYAKCEARPIHMRHHAWFCGFAPADNPEITVAAFSRNTRLPWRTGRSSDCASDIMQAALEKYHPDVI